MSQQSASIPTQANQTTTPFPISRTSRYKSQKDRSNPRATAVWTLCAAMFLGLIGLPALFLVFLSTALSQGVIVTALTGSYAVAETVHLSWEKYAVGPIETGDIEAQKEFIKFINPVENGWNTMLTFSQIGIAMWDYTVPIVIYLVQLFFDVLMPLFKFLFASSFPFLMELALMRVELLRMMMQAAVEVFQALAVALNGSEFEEDAINTSGAGSAGPVGGDVNAVPGETVGATPLSFLNSFRKVSRFFLRIRQVALFAAAKILISLDINVLKLVDWLMNVVIKFLPTLMKCAAVVIDLLDPSSPLGRAIFTCFDLCFRFFELIYGTCEVQEGILKAMCVYTSIYNSVFKKIENVLNVNLPNFPNCNIKTIGENCKKPPPNPFEDLSFVGVGICNEQSCVEETIAIIQEVELERPACSDWVATANATLACMSIVYNYATTKTNYTGNTKIDTIAKELCFVLTVNVLSQCGQSLPPFGFSNTQVANAICVVDRSGLSPPAPPFNDQCACRFTAPLCEAGCCNQYARHIVGQSLFYIGGFTCGQFLVQFPETFWCQFSTTTASNITASSDYTFSAAWCQAYRSVFFPACFTASPLATVASMTTPSLVTDFSYTICNSTVSQTGVCERINTTTSIPFVDFQYSLGEVSLPLLYQNMPPLGSTTFITIPTASTPVGDISTMDIKKYYCYAFFQTFNATNPTISSRPNSPYAAVQSYCIKSLGEQYGNYDLLNYTIFKLITPNGEPKPINLASIPPGVSPFSAVFGGGPPVPAQQTPVCTNNQTGYNPQEVSTQLACVGQQGEQTVVTANALTDSGTEAFDGLAVNSVVFAPASSLSGRGNTSIESQQLDAAVAVPTNYEVVSSADTVSITSNYRTNYPTPPPDAGTPFYIRYMNNAAGRNLLSVNVEEQSDETNYAEDEEEEDFDGQKRQNISPEQIAAHKRRQNVAAKIINNFYLGIDAGLAHLASQIQDVGTFRMPPSIRHSSALRGRARAKKLVQIIYDDFANSTSRFFSSRKLMKVGDPTFDYYVDQFWDTVANTNIQYTGINEEQTMELLSEQALRDLQIVFSHTSDVWLVNLYNFLFAENVTIQDLNEEGLDYSYEFGGSVNTGRCKNTLAEPLRCCGPRTSPYGCCYGIPLICIPMVPDYFYTPVTTLENIDAWRCTRFKGFFNMWSGTVKVIVTATVRFSLELSPVDFSGAAKFFLGWVTFDGFVVPPFSVQCMFVNLKYILLGICIIWIVALFLATQTISQMIIYVQLSSQNIRSEWRAKRNKH